jgi:ferredoxin
MVNITFKTGTGEQVVAANVGETLLTTAQKNGVKLFGACRGAGVCGTCHVYVKIEFLGSLGEIGADEEDLLGSLPNMKNNSRLACQIVITEEMDGMVVTIPSS